MRYIGILILSVSCLVSMDTFSCDAPDENASFNAEAEIVEVIQDDVTLKNGPPGKYCLALVKIKAGDEVFDRKLNIKKTKGFSCMENIEFSAFFTFDNMCVELVAYPWGK